MNFAGWSLVQIAPVLFAVAVPITALYLLKTRRREVTVPFADLWAAVQRDTDSRRLWRRLRQVLSWLLQMAILLLICLALADPRAEDWLSPPRTVAIIIDRSASMAAPAAAPETGSRLQAAASRALQEIAALGPRDRALVLAAGQDVDILLPLGGMLADLPRELTSLSPSLGEAELPAAIALASDVLAESGSSEIIIITDGALAGAALSAATGCSAESTPPCTLVTIAGEPDNVAIRAFAARRYPSERERVEALIEVANLGDRPRDVVVVVRTAGEGEQVELARKALRLEPGASQRETLRELDAAYPFLEAFLIDPTSSEGDAAAPRDGEEGAATSGSFGPTADDRAWAVVPPVSPVEVVLVSDGRNLFLEAALLALEQHVRIAAITPAQARAGHEALGRAQLVFFDIGDDVLPDPLPPTNLVIFDPHRRANAPASIDKRNDLVRPRLTEQERKHPIMEGVVFKDVNLARGTSLRLEPGDLPLVSHLGEPMIVLRERPTGSLLVMGFDPRQSDLPLRVAFPLLVANVVDWFEHRAPGFVASITAGAGRELVLADLGLDDATITRVEVEGPDRLAIERAVDRGRVRVDARVPGIYRLRALDGDSAGAEVAVAANATDQGASISRSQLPDDHVSREAPSPAPTRAADEPPWIFLVWLVVGALALEWLGFHRRRTV